MADFSQSDEAPGSKRGRNAAALLERSLVLGLIPPAFDALEDTLELEKEGGEYYLKSAKRKFVEPPVHADYNVRQLLSVTEPLDVPLSRASPVDALPLLDAARREHFSTLKPRRSIKSKKKNAICH